MKLNYLDSETSKSCHKHRKTLMGNEEMGLLYSLIKKNPGFLYRVHPPPLPLPTTDSQKVGSFCLTRYQPKFIRSCLPSLNQSKGCHFRPLFSLVPHITVSENKCNHIIALWSKGNKRFHFHYIKFSFHLFEVFRKSLLASKSNVQKCVLKLKYPFLSVFISSSQIGLLQRL